MGLMTLSEEIAVSVATVIGATLSLSGSICIIWNIIWRRKYKQDTYHRLLLGICSLNVLGAVGWLMAPFAPPKATTPRYLPIGNIASCTSQAFLIQTGVGFMIYNACLSIYYVLMVRYNVSKKRMIWREKIMHAVAIVWGIGSAIIPVPLEIFNELGLGSGCWIHQTPIDCGTEVNPVPCERGGNIDTTAAGAILTGVPAVSSILIVLFCNALLYITVRGKEVESSRFSDVVASRRSSRMRERTKEIAAQATWYVIIFTWCHIWEMLFALLHQMDVISSENESNFTALIFVGQFFAASNGLGFLMVYVRPRFLRLRKRNVSCIKAIYIAVSFRETPHSAMRASQRQYGESGTGSASSTNNDSEH
ncbi:hypothetical protein MHU86_4359 [Fragilaria crotonensis]|nr:hypothetical protein MHU86_4359 [Fragilaria crotonensis]